MAYDAVLADRVRHALLKTVHVEEKTMFGGLTFMVNGKMCLSVGRDRLMCRVDPALSEDLSRRKGCCKVVMRGRPLNGYFHVDREALNKPTEFNFWVNSALTYNRQNNS